MAEPLSPSARLRADAALLGITAIWGSTFVLVKDALDRASPFVFLALRFALAGAVVTVLARGQLRDRASVRRGLVLGVFVFVGFALQTFGLADTTPSRSAFITGLSVALVPFVAVFLFRRWPRVPSLLGIALAVIGLYWLTLSGSAPSGGARLRGDLLTLGCAVAYAFHIAINERFAAISKIFAMVAVQLWVVSLLSAICIPFFGGKLVLDGVLVWGVVFTGLFATALAILVQTWGQARTTAVRAALIFSLEPVFAAVYSVLLGREQLGAKEAVGGGLIVLGVAVAEVGNTLIDRWALARG